MKGTNKKHNLIWLVPVLIFVVCFTSCISILHSQYKRSKNIQETRAELNAVIYTDTICEQMNVGVQATVALEQVLLNDGGISDFDLLAKNLMQESFSSLQLAPGGVVTKIYPLEGNEGGFVDLINDEVRRPYAEYAIQHDEVVMQGPFDLKQGGKGIAVRNPVFLTDESGGKTFWGFTICIIKVPDIFEEWLRSLNEFGYNYTLSCKNFTDETKTDVVASSGGNLDRPISREFRIGARNWLLAVEPVEGWKVNPTVWVFFAWGIALTVALTVLSVFIIIVEKKRRAFRGQAYTDGLTGLFNRIGFSTAFQKYVVDNPEEPCVCIMMDLDDFKFINDLYGHDVGDAALVSLASDIRKNFPHGSISARTGGDEFLVVLKNTDKATAEKLVSDFASMQHSFVWDGKSYSYGVSLGYADYPANTKNQAELTGKADIALYEAKLHGKRSYRAYNESFNINSDSRKRLGFALSDVSDNLPGAFLIYKADPNDDRILFANDELVRFAGCSDLDDFLGFCDGRFGKLIRPDEQADVENSIWKQINAHSDGSNDYVQFHFATRDGGYKLVLDHGRIVDNEHYGRVFYVLIYDEELIRKRYEINK